MVLNAHRNKYCFSMAPEGMHYASRTTKSGNTAHFWQLFGLHANRFFELIKQKELLIIRVGFLNKIWFLIMAIEKLKVSRVLHQNLLTFNPCRARSASKRFLWLTDHRFRAENTNAPQQLALGLYLDWYRRWISSQCHLMDMQWQPDLQKDRNVITSAFIFF